MLDKLAQLLPAIAAGLAASVLMEQLLNPKPVACWQRPAAVLALHGGLWLLLFSAELLLFQRPWFATANVLTLQLLIVLVSNAKFAVLREPFVYQDFEYFTDAIKHPRLYLPFFGLWKTITATAAFMLALWGGLSLETSLLQYSSTSAYLLTLLTVLLMGLGLVWLGAKQPLSVSFLAEQDLQRLGLFASLWCYAKAEAQPCTTTSVYDQLRPSAKPQLLANLVVVQSESFFDVRDYYAAIRPEVLAAYDSLKASARQYGKLRTPAWGANTVRTEFGFLSGISPEQLGVHRFNPYRKFARQGVGNLAGFLKRQGYRTVCVHPYPASFYARDIVLPLLGFDEFIDIQSFAETDKAGPFVGDVALAEKVCSLLTKNASQPVFVFVISMENHGPLHLETVQAADQALYSSEPPAYCDDLSIYLRHLGNADRMAGRLRDHLSSLPGANWLCWYGDHVPIMADVYAGLGMPDGQTDYLIWGSESTAKPPERVDLAVESLGELVLRHMGFV
jgi:hypothetical protein